MSVSIDQIRQEFNRQAFGKPVLFGEFFHYAVEDKAMSKRTGFPMYNTKVFVRIKTQGRKDTTVRLATEEDKAMFKEQWQKFEERQELGALTPLNTLPGYTVEAEFTLKDLGVKSAEELAEYDGELPTYEMNVMRDAAQHLQSFWIRYTPPEKHDVTIPESRNHHGPDDGQEVREGHYLEMATRNSAPQRENGIGVFLDEEGNVAGFGGFAQEEAVHEEAVQEKSYDEEVFVAPDPDELLGSFVA